MSEDLKNRLDASTLQKFNSLKGKKQGTNNVYVFEGIEFKNKSKLLARLIEANIIEHLDLWNWHQTYFIKAVSKIKFNHPVSFNRIKQALGCGQASTSMLISSWYKAGLIKSDKDPDDRRKKVYTFIGAFKNE